MNKQIDNKVIEEMAKIIATQACISNKDGVCRLDKKPCDLCCNTSILFKECAEALYNAGYRKIAEGSVVLSKEEQIQKNHEIAYWKERAEMAKTAMFTLRQDTINEVVELLKEKDCEELANLVNQEFSIKARKYTTQNLIDQACKETAREILSWAKRVAKPTYYNVDDNPRKEGIILLSDICKFFKEKYGVEVK